MNFFRTIFVKKVKNSIFPDLNLVKLVLLCYYIIDNFAANYLN